MSHWLEVGERHRHSASVGPELHYVDLTVVSCWAHHFTSTTPTSTPVDSLQEDG